VLGRPAAGAVLGVLPGPVRRTRALSTECSPQPWAATTPIHLVASLMRYETHVSHGSLWLDPVLPESYGDLHLTNAPMAGGCSGSGWAELSRRVALRPAAVQRRSRAAAKSQQEEFLGAERRPIDTTPRRASIRVPVRTSSSASVWPRP
jgi:hypothetical protein